MRQSSRSTITFTDKGSIREITGSNYQVFKQFSIGKKLLFVRETLEELHSKKEFSRGKVAKAGMSYQGLKNIEEEHNKRPYNGTIELLCRIYDLPLKLFTDEGYCNAQDGFLIGKRESKEQFFEDFYRMNFHRNRLDPRYGEMPPDESEHVDIDTDAYDVIHNDDGSISFDRYTIEISLKMYQTSSKSIIGNDVIVENTVLAPEDVAHLKEVIQREVAYMQSKFTNSQENRPREMVKLIQEHIKRRDQTMNNEE